MNDLIKENAMGHIGFLAIKIGYCFMWTIGILILLGLLSFVFPPLRRLFAWFYSKLWYRSAKLKTIVLCVDKGEYIDTLWPKHNMLDIVATICLPKIRCLNPVNLIVEAYAPNQNAKTKIDLVNPDFEVQSTLTENWGKQDVYLSVGPENLQKMRRFHGDWIFKAYIYEPCTVERNYLGLFRIPVVTEKALDSAVRCHHSETFAVHEGATYATTNLDSDCELFMIRSLFKSQYATEHYKEKQVHIQLYSNGSIIDEVNLPLGIVDDGMTVDSVIYKIKERNLLPGIYKFVFQLGEYSIAEIKFQIFSDLDNFYMPKSLQFIGTLKTGETTRILGNAILGRNLISVIPLVTFDNSRCVPWRKYNVKVVGMKNGEPTNELIIDLSPDQEHVLPCEFQLKNVPRPVRISFLIESGGRNSNHELQLKEMPTFTDAQGRLLKSKKDDVDWDAEMNMILAQEKVRHEMNNKKWV